MFTVHNVGKCCRLLPPGELDLQVSQVLHVKLHMKTKRHTLNKELIGLECGTGRKESVVGTKGMEHFERIRLKQQLLSICVCVKLQKSKHIVCF